MCRLYEGFDPNGNGYLSLAEVRVHKGCRDVLGLPEIYENKPVMMRAFAAKGANNAKSKSELGQHYIERSEFRLLLVAKFSNMPWIAHSNERRGEAERPL